MRDVWDGFVELRNPSENRPALVEWSYAGYLWRALDWSRETCSWVAERCEFALSNGSGVCTRRFALQLRNHLKRAVSEVAMAYLLAGGHKSDMPWVEMEDSTRLVISQAISALAGGDEYPAQSFLKMLEASRELSKEMQLRLVFYYKKTEDAWKELEKEAPDGR